MDFELSEMEKSEEAISQLVEPDAIDPADTSKRILAILAEKGITEQSAADCRCDSSGMGALSGLGYALTDLCCQPHLFDPVTRIMINAGTSLRIAMTVAFLEPYLREPFELTDEGFREYLKWLFKLQDDPRLRWAVEEAYELHGGDEGLKRDIELLSEFVE